MIVGTDVYIKVFFDNADVRAIEIYFAGYFLQQGTKIFFGEVIIMQAAEGIFIVGVANEKYIATDKPFCIEIKISCHAVILWRKKIQILN